MYHHARHAMRWTLFLMVPAVLLHDTAFGMVLNTTEAVIIHKKIHGREEGDNRFRHEGSLLAKADKTHFKYDREALRAQKLAMYHGVHHAPKPPPVTKQPSHTTVPARIEAKQSYWAIYLLCGIFATLAFIIFSVLSQARYREMTAPRERCKQLGCPAAVFIGGLCKKHYEEAQEAIKRKDESFF